jgi:HK97 family phage prohead protease
MDGKSREDVERRLIETEAVVERCMCDKTGKKKVTIRGYAALFNTRSQDLGGFVESILPGAFDEVMKRGTDVVALYNHEPMYLLGRESAGTLRLSVDERGLRYEIDAPESRADVIEAIERGDVRGSSFAFRVKGDGEKWSRTAEGGQLREIRNIDGLFDVGPVLKPAYTATEAFVSRRALEIAQAEKREEPKSKGFRPTAGMASAAKRGLKLHEEGKSGDGLKPETVARANKIARRERLTEEHVVEMAAWFKRHEASKTEGWDQPPDYSPAFVAWLLWGGNAAKNWSARKSAAMKKKDDREAPEPEAVEVREEPEAEEAMPSEPAGSLSQANYDLYESIEKIANENGQWPQSGVDGAHYMAKSPFGSSGMRCENCVFWNSGGSCDVVQGEIAKDGLCKLWVIPEEKLSVEDPLEKVAEGDDAPTLDQVAARSVDAAAEAARLKAKALEVAAKNGRRT